MEQEEGELRAQVEALTAQAATLRRELRQARREHEASLMGADRKLAVFAEEKRRELEACQGQIRALEKAMSGYVRLEEKVDDLTLENVFLNSKLAEERRLFMSLVLHAADGKALERMSERHERGEETIAELTKSNTNLAKANKNLTVAHEALMTELDRVTQERDFLRAATPPTPAQPQQTPFSDWASPLRGRGPESAEATR
jgi:chromosome segregation ATPase